MKKYLLLSFHLGCDLTTARCTAWSACSATCGATGQQTRSCPGDPQNLCQTTRDCNGLCK